MKKKNYRPISSVRGAILNGLRLRRGVECDVRSWLAGALGVGGESERESRGENSVATRLLVMVTRGVLLQRIDPGVVGGA